MSRMRFRFYFYTSCVAFFIILFAYILRQFLLGLPSIFSLEEYTPSLTTHLYDVRGQRIADLFTERRALIPLSHIPVDLQNAVIAVEDDQFFKHWGVSPRGILRATVYNFWKGRVVQGGSTITQQLSRGIFLNPERKLIRKIREVLLAFQIERNLSKQEILQMYLNQIYFGHGAYGVQAAARTYFAKEVSALTLGECALLAGLISSPANFSPFTHPESALRRRNIVLSRMMQEGYLKSGEMQKALQELIPTERPPALGTEAPYFVEHVRQILEPRYGTDTLWKGGLKIYTTLDLRLQKIAEEIMEKSLTAFDEQAAKELEKKAKENPSDVELSTVPPRIQGAFTILDVNTGAIRVMIGGRDYKVSQFNRATQALRQPGSTFKPFVWTATLMNGYTPSSIVEDLPVAYYYDGRDWRLLEGATDQFSISLATAPFAENPDFDIWVPNDYDGRFLGPITLRKALELSRNVASVWLIERVGPPLVVEVAHRLGIKSRLDPVPALGLGSSVISPLELANAFATFADMGIRVDSYEVVRVEDNQGKILERHVPMESEALDPRIAYLMVSMMKGVVERGTGRYARRVNRPLAGKTGTTQDHRDLWFVGYTPDLVAAAWMGYDDDTSLGRKDLTGGSTVVPWWTEIMKQVLKEYPARDFVVPDGITFVKVDSDSGQLALPTCPKQILETFQKGTEPKTFCELDHEKPELVPLQEGTTAPVSLSPTTSPP
ncbi:MAG: transglycosylase domain-containing protein [Elusimicrobia bacterium]|nr:transglycosylase domain-containing protein [Elusimicrobiota bacterium]